MRRPRFLCAPRLKRASFDLEVGGSLTGSEPRAIFAHKDHEFAWRERSQIFNGVAHDLSPDDRRIQWLEKRPSLSRAMLALRRGIASSEMPRDPAVTDWTSGVRACARSLDASETLSVEEPSRCVRHDLYMSFPPRSSLSHRAIDCTKLAATFDADRLALADTLVPDVSRRRWLQRRQLNRLRGCQAMHKWWADESGEAGPPLYAGPVVHFGFTPEFFVFFKGAS
jgi:hypothetical protein